MSAVCLGNRTDGKDVHPSLKMETSDMGLEKVGRFGPYLASFIFDVLSGKKVTAS